MIAIEHSLYQCLFMHTSSSIPYHETIGELFSLLFIEMEVGSTFKGICPERDEERLTPNSAPFQRFCSGYEAPTLFLPELYTPI